MNAFTRYLAKITLAGSIALSMAAAAAHAEDKVVRIGLQKYGTLILLKTKGLLEEKLKPQGYTVEWTEFPAGPQLLEALNVGSIDFGTTGEAPPIFAQPPAHRWSMSAMNRRHRKPRRSSFRRTARLRHWPT